MVSKASEDLPEPDSPVMQTSELRGRRTVMSLRLCSRAPWTTSSSFVTRASLPPWVEREQVFVKACAEPPRASIRVRDAPTGWSPDGSAILHLGGSAAWSRVHPFVVSPPVERARAGALPARDRAYAARRSTRSRTSRALGT